MLAQGTHPDALSPGGHHHGMRLLAACAEQGWRAGVQMLIAPGADVHMDNDWTLGLAAEGGHVHGVELLLLAAGADVHADEDWAPRWAALRGHADVVQRLLAAGADAHVRAGEALCWAAAREHLPVVRILFTAADPASAREVVLYSAIVNEHLPIVECLFAAGADAAGGKTARQQRDILTAPDAIAAAIPPDQHRRVLRRARPQQREDGIATPGGRGQDAPIDDRTSRITTIHGKVSADRYPAPLPENIRTALPPRASP